MTPRERLLEAAIRSLQERGYARTTTRQIVASAGLHLPAVNYYFGSKETLLQEAIVEAVRRWGATTMSVVGAVDDDPAERLKRSLQRFLETLEADRPYVVAAAEAFAQAERSEALRDRLGDAYDEFRQVVAASVRDASGAADAIPDEDLLALSSTLIALFDGLAIQSLIDPAGSPGAAEVMRSLAVLASLAAAGSTESRG